MAFLSKLAIAAFTLQVSINAFMHENFRDLVQTLDSRITIPKSSHTIRRAMISIRKAVDKALKRYIHKVKNRISCVFDIWSVNDSVMSFV